MQPDRRENSNDMAFGVRADKGEFKSKMDIFNRPAETVDFFRKGLGETHAQLPPHIKAVDFGGGTGFLAKTAKEWLTEHGHTVDITVTDANAEYLNRAKNAFQLDTTEPSDLRKTVFLENGKPSLDLAIMRSKERHVGKECRSRWSPYH